VNLKAPVIINPKRMKGTQIICRNDDYPVKYFLFEEDGPVKKEL
jgi:flagellar assembly factor FliW